MTAGLHAPKSTDDSGSEPRPPGNPPVVLIDVLGQRFAYRVTENAPEVQPPMRCPLRQRRCERGASGPPSNRVR